MTRAFSRPVAALLALACLSACATEAPHKTPDPALPATFAAGQARPVGDITTEEWWRELDDPVLNRLIDRALASNLSIAEAMVRIDQARAAERATGLTETLGGTATLSGTRSGGDIPSSTTTSGSLMPSLVLDLFGGIRQGQARAAADLSAATQDVGTARLAMLSSVIGYYLDLRYDERAMALTRAGIDTRRRTLELVKSQLKVGLGSDLDVARAQSNFESAEAELPRLQSDYFANLFAIATLLAEPAQPIAGELGHSGRIPRPGKAGSTGVPADLLRNRPDIRAAEQRLAAAWASVGVARAELYPSLSLTGSVTFATTDTWSYGPRLSLPLFNHAALDAAKDKAVAAAQEQELVWRATILQAVQEVQSAQANLSAARQELESRSRVTAAAERVQTLSEATYREGATSLIDLLTDQRSYADARQAEAKAQHDLALSWAKLQTAIGRGAHVAL